MACRIVAPFPLHREVQHVSDPRDPLEAKAHLHRKQLVRQRDVVLDRPVAAHMVDRVRDQPVRPPFGGDPEPAVAIQRDALHVHQLRGLTLPRDANGVHDPGGRLDTSMWKIVGCIP
jgi:hypothetical protein